jgi:hypothetical protein
MNEEPNFWVHSSPWNLAANIAEDCVAPNTSVVHVAGLSDVAEEVTIILQ